MESIDNHLLDVSCLTQLKLYFFCVIIFYIILLKKPYLCYTGNFYLHEYFIIFRSSCFVYLKRYKIPLTHLK